MFAPGCKASPQAIRCGPASQAPHRRLKNQRSDSCPTLSAHDWLGLPIHPDRAPRPAGKIRAADPVGEFARILRQTPDLEDKEKIAAHLGFVEKGSAAAACSDLRRLCCWGNCSRASVRNNQGFRQMRTIRSARPTRGAKRLAQRLKTSLRSSRPLTIRTGGWRRSSSCPKW